MNSNEKFEIALITLFTIVVFCSQLISLSIINYMDRMDNLHGVY